MWYKITNVGKKKNNKGRNWYRSIVPKASQRTTHQEATSKNQQKE